MPAWPARPREIVPLSYGALLRELARTFTSARDDEAAREALRAAIARELGVPHVSLFSSCRAGLRALLDELGRRRPGAAVLVNNYNFFAVPRMVEAAGLRAVPVDPGDPEGELTAEDVAAAMSADTCAVIASHHFGRPSAVDAIGALCRARGVALVEDCAHAFGARVGGESAGAFGLGGAFSLSLTKSLTGAAGGIVITRDDGAARRLASFERRGAACGAGEVRRTVAAAVAGKALLGRSSYGALAHLPNLLAMHAGRDVLEALMGEAPAAGPAAVEIGALHPGFARLALGHLPSVAGEIAARRATARALLDEARAAGVGRRVRLPAWEPDRLATFLMFAVRTDGVDRLRLRLLRAGFDTRRDYLGPIDPDPARFPRSTRLPRETLYLPIRALRGAGDRARLVDVLLRFEREALTAGGRARTAP